MAKIVQLHRMSSAQATLYVGPDGEAVVDTGSHRLRIQDGATPGGFGTLISNLNLSDISDPVAARNNLGAAGLISPSFTTPVLGTPSSGNLANCTGYDMVDLVGLGTGVATALAAAVNLAGGLATAASYVEGTVVAAASINLATSGAPNQSVTGDTNIAAMTGANMIVNLRFTGKPTITYNAVSMITPGARDLPLGPGDNITVSIDGANNVRIIKFLPFGSVTPQVVNAAPGVGYTQMAVLTLTPGRWKFMNASVQSRASSANDLRGAISDTTASSSGTVPGVTDVSSGPNAATGIFSFSMPISEVVVSGVANKQFFFNFKMDVPGPTVSGLFWAERSPN